MVVPPARDAVPGGRPGHARRRVRAAALTTAVLSAAAVAGVAAPAPLLAAQPFSGVAAADGVRVSVAARGFLVVEQLADAGVPTAQSSADPLDAIGYAGYPYPGDAVFVAIDLARARSGAPIPDYPGAARSDSTNPESKKEYGPVLLQSTSGDGTAVATASAPLASGGMTAGKTAADTTVAYAPTGTVTAEAATTAEAVEVPGGVLRIGAVSSSAKVTAALDGKRVKTSSLRVSNVTIAGQTVGFDEKGLTVAGQSVPLPDTSPLINALKSQQITVAYLAPEETEDGIIAAGIRVTVVRAVSGLPEPLEISYVFGRARAGGTGGVDTDAAPDLGAGPEPVGDSAAAAPPPSVPEALPAPVEDAGAGSFDAAAPVAAAPPASDVGPPPVAAAPVQEQTPALSPVNRLRAAPFDAAMFYLVLVVGGMFLVGGASLLRLFGVRAIWTG